MASTIYNLGDIAREAAAIFNPPERLRVSESAQKYVYLNNSPKYVGYWKPHETPYMIEPQDMLMSEDHTGLVFCGSSQTGKTQALLLNGIAHIVKCNPMDILLFGPSQPASRDFSKRRIDRMHRESEDLRSELLPGRHADNTHDKSYKSGIMLSISWPSLNEMSSKPVPVVMLTEYDRMPDDVDGEGSPFLLSQKRATSFLNMAMTVAESSPARFVEDPHWKPETPHEAPPCTGILGLYNEGDRRRWYWPCPECGEYFEGSFSNLTYLTTKVVDGERVKMSHDEIMESVYMACPHSGCMIAPHHKYEMNLKGVWLPEGVKIDRNGVRSGTPRRSKTVSYWLKGPAAAYTTWPELVSKLLAAEEKYEKTGSQEDLKTTYNTDQAEPYTPRGNETNRLAEDIMNLARPLKKHHVPHDVRALFATVDVQKPLWQVQVMGIKPENAGFSTVVIDRFAIEKSKRLDEDGERLRVEPATYLEDWELLVEQVMDKRYPLYDENGTMGVSMTFCDSGGKEGVTTNAYNFYRSLVERNRQNRFMLLKGDPRYGIPRAAVTWPDTKRADRKAHAAGEIPLLVLNSNALKDMLNGWLERKTPGPGKIDFPDWLGLHFYEELTAETRSVRGWENKAKRRNESWDLLAYFLGACVWRGVEKVDWDNPPVWLRPWDENPLVQRGAEAQPEKEVVDKSKALRDRIAQLAADLA